jgi:hypothetical protein
MQHDYSAINATFTRHAQLRQHFHDIGDTCATCARFRRIFPRLSAIGRLTSCSVFPCPTKFPGMHFSIYHLFHYRTMFIDTWYTFFTSLYHTTFYHYHHQQTPITFYHHHHTQLSSTSFYYVLNISSQALVAVSSSGYLCISHLISISEHILTSRYHTAFAQFRFSTRDFPALRAPIAPLFPRFRLIARFALSP